MEDYRQFSVRLFSNMKRLDLIFGIKRILNHKNSTYNHNK